MVKKISIFFIVFLSLPRAFSGIIDEKFFSKKEVNLQSFMEYLPTDPKETLSKREKVFFLHHIFPRIFKKNRYVFNPRILLSVFNNVDEDLDDLGENEGNPFIEDQDETDLDDEWVDEEIEEGVWERVSEDEAEEIKYLEDLGMI